VLTAEPSCKDEARIGQQGTISRIWAKRGTRPRIKRDRRFTWAYLFGAICPVRGTGAALVMPTVNLDVMNMHLAEISRRVSTNAIALLILDGARWHQSPRLVVPDNIVLMPLPPYAPELNATENI
jgi:DDE superfamily endonuclease